MPTVREVSEKNGIHYLDALEKILSAPRVSRIKNAQRPKRGSGLTKARCDSILKKLEKGKLKNIKAAKINFIKITDALNYHYPKRFRKIAKEEKLRKAVCPGCLREYYPPTKKNSVCSARCRSREKTNKEYFGGNRLKAAGLLDGVCQICEYEKPSLAAHHVLGKGNDPEDRYLIAACKGCHDVLTRLARMNTCIDSRKMEILLNWVLIRKGVKGVNVRVSYVVQE